MLAHTLCASYVCCFRSLQNVFPELPENDEMPCVRCWKYWGRERSAPFVFLQLQAPLDSEKNEFEQSLVRIDPTLFYLK